MSYLISQHLVCKTVFGSHLYGTQTPSSDRDLKGIFVPSVRAILLGQIPKTAPLSEIAVDGNLFSLHSFLHLATQGQTVAIDMLWTPASQVERGPYAWIWDRIVENRQRLLSKQMNAFVGYARGQASKYSLKGERLRLLQAFHDILYEHSDAYGGDPNRPIGMIWNLLPFDLERKNPQGIIEGQIAGKWYGYSTSFTHTLESVRKRLADYGQRSHTAADAAGLDWKALSHAVRVSRELKELLTEGDLQFPLRDRELLLKIKTGQIAIDQVRDILDRDLLEIETLTKQSSLPETVDMTWWDQFLIDIMSEHVSNELVKCLKT